MMAAYHLRVSGNQMRSYAPSKANGVRWSPSTSHHLQI